MKEKRLLKALGQVDADYIEEASPTKQAKRPHWMKWGAIAACLVLICVATIHFSLAPTPGGTSTTTNTGITTGNISGEGDQDVDKCFRLYGGAQPCGRKRVQAYP